MRLAGRALRVRFAVGARIPPGLFERRSERRVIIAPTHQSLADPWLRERAVALVEQARADASQ